MRSKLLRVVLFVCFGLAVGVGTVVAQPKNKGKSGQAGGDQTMDKQMAWEQKVMGDDSAKRADMKKIAAAQKLAEEAKKNPAPAPAPKVKDPNKEGVRAKQEAAIGLPIADEAPQHASKKAAVAKKTSPAPSGGNDELGALVASSLAEDRKADPGTSASGDDEGQKGKRGHKGKAKGGKAHAAASSGPPSSLDRLLTSGN